MPALPDDLFRYFSGLSYGLEALLPSCRVKNKDFLLALYDCLSVEPILTVHDREHLETLKIIADQVELLALDSVKAFCEAEAYVIKACPNLRKSETRWAMKWACLIMARHGQVESEPETIGPEFLIWRTVQTFHPIEQGFITGLIGWMTGKKFSSTSILETLREFQKFKRWMDAQGIHSMALVGNVELNRYLLSRANHHTNASKQKFLGSLRPVFHYYQEAIDGGFTVPDTTVRAPRPLGINQSATSEEIDRLWHALEGERLPPTAALMLALIIGYGLPLRALPLLELTAQPGLLLWKERLACRKGVQEREICLDLSIPWLSRLWGSALSHREASPDYLFLFTSAQSNRRKYSVSAEHCQRLVQGAVQEVLGYAIPVNHLERGTFKRLAAQKSLSDFMYLTGVSPKSRLTRMVYWLEQNKKC